MRGRCWRCPARRALIFSHSVRMLDIIERCLMGGRLEGGAGLSSVARIEGQHSDLERQETIAAFNKNNDIPVCLVR